MFLLLFEILLKRPNNLLCITNHIVNNTCTKPFHWTIGQRRSCRHGRLCTNLTALVVPLQYSVNAAAVIIPVTTPSLALPLPNMQT